MLNFRLPSLRFRLVLEVGRKVITLGFTYGARRR